MAVKRMRSNELIGHLADRPETYVIQTMTRRVGPTWCTSDLRLLDERVCLRLIEKGILVERNAPTLKTDRFGSQSYELAPTFRDAERERLSTPLSMKRRLI